MAKKGISYNASKKCRKLGDFTKEVGGEDGGCKEHKQVSKETEVTEVSVKKKRFNK